MTRNFEASLVRNMHDLWDASDDLAAELRIPPGGRVLIAGLQARPALMNPGRYELSCWQLISVDPPRWIRRRRLRESSGSGRQLRELCPPLCRWRLGKTSKRGRARTRTSQLRAQMAHRRPSPKRGCGGWPGLFVTENAPFLPPRYTHHLDPCPANLPADPGHSRPVAPAPTTPQARYRNGIRDAEALSADGTVLGAAPSFPPANAALLEVGAFPGHDRACMVAIQARPPGI